QRRVQVLWHTIKQSELRIIGRRYFARRAHRGSLPFRSRQYCMDPRAFATASEGTGLTRTRSTSIFLNIDVRGAIRR
ncbi:hypothetical protein P3T40_009185, partial [Paraburkholderia sp. EB58]|uniref:hypothetical protein n=1 Tax=Paraburkholderia sp. EB58 TaxID=3035125 RepID=UPI003D2586BD